MRAAKKKIVTAVVGALCLFAVAAALAVHMATKILQARVQAALGENGAVAEVIVHWSSIELRGVRVRAPAGWPASDALRADKIVVRPDLGALISAQLHVSAVVVENPYVSISRSRDGHPHLLPGILGDTPETAGAPAVQAEPQAHPIDIGKVEIHRGQVEFFDASIKRPAQLIRIEQIEAKIEGIHVPKQAGRMTLKIDGIVKGVHSDGKMGIYGWLDPVSLDSDITTNFSGVDLITLQPYLVKAAETGVKSGKLDMTLHARVQDRHLKAPGSITLIGLELDSGNGAMATFMGIPRRAAIASLKDKGDRIVVPFSLDGNIDDPHFSLNENLATHLGGAVANVLGIGIEGMAHGVGDTAEGVQGMVKKLLGK